MSDRDDLGELAADGARHRLSFTRFLPHPPETVWRAISEPDHLSAWFPARVDGERRAGAPLRFVFEHDEGPTLDGAVEVWDPPHVFAFTWGEESLRFELEAADGGTVLSFVNTFDELGKAARDAAGWHYCLEGLGHHLAGDQSREDPVARWKTLNRDYVERFGPEASTEGPPPDTHPEYA